MFLIANEHFGSSLNRWGVENYLGEIGYSAKERLKVEP